MRLTRRQLLTALGGGAAAAVLAACQARLPATPSRAGTSGQPPSPTPAVPPSATPSPAPAEPDLATKAAGMLLVGFRGFVPGPPTVEDLSRGLGGVVLFDRDQPTGGPRNIESPGQVADLSAALWNAAAPPGSLVISTDEEGGLVARLDDRHGFPPTISAAELGAMDDPPTTEAAARGMAETLAAAGINLNLAPVVDVNVNPNNPIIGALDRSFSADPAVVAEQALAFIRGQHATGVLTTLKHFPGHGSSTGDTHLGVVDVTETWSDRELEPFATIIDADMADAILTAHVFNANLDPNHPATLSNPTITGLLRGDLGYDGVVISDDLQMGAIREAYGYEEAVRLAIEAGIDILTIANQQVYEEDIVARTVEFIVGLVDEARIDAARIDESWRRIASLRSRLIA